MKAKKKVPTHLRLRLIDEESVNNVKIAHKVDKENKLHTSVTFTKWDIQEITRKLFIEDELN